MTVSAKHCPAASHAVFFLLLLFLVLGFFLLLG